MRALCAPPSSAALASTQGGACCAQAAAPARSRTADPSAATTPLTGLPVGEPHLVVADPVEIPFHDGLPGDALAVELDAVGRAHVHHVVLPVEELDHRVLPR